MKVKKTLALLLSLVLTMGLLPGRALAARKDEFTIVNTEQELISALGKGTEKIKLGKDISSTSFFALEQKVVIDLDGHTWIDTRDRPDFLSTKDGGNVIVQNGTATFSIVMEGGELILKELELNGAVFCDDGKLVSMEDCTMTGGNGSDYPVGIIVREDGAVGAIKNCTINITGNVTPSPLIVEGGSVDTIEGCTITATNKGTERWFHAVNLMSGGSVGSIKNCAITANGKNYCTGINIDEDSSVKVVEGCTITAKNTTTDDESKFDDGISVGGKIGTMKECKITARTAVVNYGKIDEISDCVLNAEYVCISAGGGAIGSIMSNTMTATGTYGKGVEVNGPIDTVSNNIVQTPFSFLHIHEGSTVDKVINNTADCLIFNNSGGELGTISGNVLAGIENRGTIALLGRNVLDKEVLNEGTIKKTDASSPVDSLDKDAWYREAVSYAYDKNLTTGIPDDDFKPGDKLTRAMLAQMLWNLEERPASGNGAFTDVASGEWYRNSVTWAAGKEIVNGYGDGLFGPNDSITREQVATILYRYVKNNGGDVSNKADLSSYTDASQISTYALEAMQWANAEKLITGTTDTTLSPQGNTTCAQMATIMMRFIEE